jgi:hypothetical protein
MKVVRLSALRTGCLDPQEIFLVLISLRGWVDPRAIVRPEVLCQWKIPMAPSGIGPATFRFVAQCLNHRAIARAIVRPWKNKTWLKILPWLNDVLSSLNFLFSGKTPSLNFIDWRIIQSRRGALKNESIILSVLNGYMKDLNRNLTWVQNRTHTWANGIIFDKVKLLFSYKSMLCLSFSLYCFYCNKNIWFSLKNAVRRKIAVAPARSSKQ